MNKFGLEKLTSFFGKKSEFDSTVTTNRCNNTYDIILSVFPTLLVMVSLYLFFKYRGNRRRWQRKIMEMLIAILFAPFYIPYRLAHP